MASAVVITSTSPTAERPASSGIMASSKPGTLRRPSRRVTPLIYANRRRSDRFLPTSARLPATAARRSLPVRSGRLTRTVASWGRMAARARRITVVTAWATSEGPFEAWGTPRRRPFGEVKPESEKSLTANRTPCARAKMTGV
jgi:hypothetical protein